MPDDTVHELISAYLDGEVSAAERERVELLLDEDASSRQYYDDLRAVRSRVAVLPRESLGRDLTAHIWAAIDEEALHGPPSSESESEPVRPAGSSRVGGKSLMWYLSAVAAAMLVAFLWQHFLPGDREVVVEPKGGGSGELKPVEPGTGILAPIAARPNFLLVYEVQLNATGVARQSFVSAVEASGIGFETAIPVGEKLERQLLTNRFFGPQGEPQDDAAGDAGSVDDGPAEQGPAEQGPAEQGPAEQGPAEQGPAEQGPQGPQGPGVEFELVYLIGGGRQIDAIHQYLLSEMHARLAVESIRMDMAIYEDDMQFFDDLHQAAESQVASADTKPDRAAVPDTPSAPRPRAQRLAMDLPFRTQLGSGLRTLSVPAAALLESLAVPGSAAKPDLGAPPRTAMRFHELESMTFGVVFVVRSAQTE